MLKQGLEIKLDSHSPSDRFIILGRGGSFVGSENKENKTIKFFSFLHLLYSDSKQLNCPLGDAKLPFLGCFSPLLNLLTFHQCNPDLGKFRKGMFK